jgi:hypothetical protein
MSDKKRESRRLTSCWRQRSARALVLTSMTVMCSIGGTAQPDSRQASRVRAARLTELPLPPNVGSPEVMVGSAMTLALLDYSDMSIHLADANGRWRSSSRGRGSGPGEVRTVGGMQFARDGSLWIADVGNGKLIIRDRSARVVREFATQTPLRNTAPSSGRQPFLALTLSPKEIAITCDSVGRTIAALPFPTDMQGRNPITLERYLTRVNDTLSVLHFRWSARSIGLRNDGRVLFDRGPRDAGPDVLSTTLDSKGSVAYRVSPRAREYAVSVASRGDTLFVLLGGGAPSTAGRVILRTLATTGTEIDRIELPYPQRQIAATRSGLFGIGERDDDFVLTEIKWN